MTLRWGILGASNFALKHMGPAIHRARGANLTALATSNTDKAAPFLEFCSDLMVHSTYEDLLADPDVDAVYIPLPNHLHVEWSRRTLEAGKHVLCEKPMTLQAGEFDDLIALRDQTGLLAAEAFMIVHHPQWHWAKQLIDEGHIGTLVHVTGAFSYDNRTDTQNIRNLPETGGGGLRDIGVYTIGSARYVTGAELSVSSARTRMENDVDVFAEVTGHIGAATYSCYVSTRMHAHQEMVFHGEKGLIRLVTPFNAGVFGQARVELHRGGLETRSKRFPSDNHYVHQVEAFGHSVETGAPYACPLEFSRGTQVAIDQVFALATGL
ncbi:Gfo/Idh/MocA family protein [Arenibacterium sp. CAU 1754]